MGDADNDQFARPLSSHCCCHLASWFLYLPGSLWLGSFKGRVRYVEARSTQLPALGPPSPSIYTYIYTHIIGGRSRCSVEKSSSCHCSTWKFLNPCIPKLAPRALDIWKTLARTSASTASALGVSLATGTSSCQEDAWEIVGLQCRFWYAASQYASMVRKAYLYVHVYTCVYIYMCI